MIDSKNASTDRMYLFFFNYTGLPEWMTQIEF